MLAASRAGRSGTERARRPLLGKDVVLFVASGPDEAAGYDPLHRLVDPPPGPCDCDDCAKELARRSPRLS